MPIAEKFRIIIPPQDITGEPGLQRNLADGDSEAFAWVYKSYCKRMYDYALLMTGNAVQSKDIVQDIFIKLWMNREKLVAIENFNSYLHILCRHHILNVFRKEKKEVKGYHHYAAQQCESCNMVEEWVDYRETQAQLQQSIRKLPSGRRQIVALKQAGVEVPTIAKHLGIQKRTVWNQLRSAHQFLRGRLAWN